MHLRGTLDLLDCLVGLGFLNREGLKETALYSNNEDVDTFLVEDKPTYMGGFLIMLDTRLYSLWGDLEKGLRTGTKQNGGGEDVFSHFY